MKKTKKEYEKNYIGRSLIKKDWDHLTEANVYNIMERPIEKI